MTRILFFFGFWNQKMGPFLGPENGTKMWPVPYVGIRNGAQFPGPKSGPRLHNPNRYKRALLIHQAIADWQC